jgi:hypothetical protein
MVRRLLLLLACAGCHNTAEVPSDVKVRSTGAHVADQRVLSGLPSEVHGRVNKAIQRAGVFGGACAAWTDEKGEGISVIGQDPNGRRFRVILQQAGSSTLATVVWDGESDEEAGRKILAGL